LAVGLIVYLIEAMNASSRIDNLILIAPAVSLALLFVAILLGKILITRFKSRAGNIQTTTPATTATAPASSPTTAPAAGTMPDPYIVVYLLVFFAIAPLSVYAGFDVAVFVFILTATWLNGERRVWVLSSYAIIFTTVVIGGFSKILSVPVPTLWERFL
jgi:hypothetical protein